jgi:lincosamide nucleotidyltransferase A/C/D/E
MEGQRVLDLVRRLDEVGIPVWLDGGWGIDALLEAQTRPHDDLDLIGRLEDVSRLEEVLAKVGYARVHGEPPLSFEMTDPQGHQVDVHPVHFNATGEAIYRMSDGGYWVYPPGSLSATGTILGREVCCQTPEMQVLAHTTGYALDSPHRDDVTALAERFDLPLPPFRSA